MPDIWSLLTGIASIVSLIISVGDRFVSWRKYTLPAACVLGGFAIGRVSPALSGGLDHLFQDPKTTGFIIVVFMILAALVIVACFLIRRGKDFFAYFMVFMAINYVILFVVPMYSKITDSVPAGDLIKLAQVKATAGEYEQALRYLESARDKATNDVLRKELQRQIDALAKEAAKVSIGEK